VQLNIIKKDFGVHIHNLTTKEYTMTTLNTINAATTHCNF